MFTLKASADIEEAYLEYESQRPGRGDNFRLALERVWELLDTFPEAGLVAHRDLRRVLVPHFPYAVYYRVGGAALEVRGCLHQHRHPRTWRRRA
jgi:plasmid stabilization system protein ParE